MPKTSYIMPEKRKCQRCADVSEVFEQLRSVFPREEYENIKRTVVLYDTLINTKRKNARKNISDAALYSSMCVEIFNELKIRFFEYYECLYAISCLGRVSNVVLLFLDGLQLCDMKQGNIDQVLDQIAQFKKESHDSVQRVKYQCQNKFSQVEFCVKYNSFQKIAAMNQTSAYSQSRDKCVDSYFQTCRIFKEVRNKFFIGSTHVYIEEIKVKICLLKKNHVHENCSIQQINEIQQNLIGRLEMVKKAQKYYENATTSVIRISNRIGMEINILEKEMQIATAKLEQLEKQSISV